MAPPDGSEDLAARFLQPTGEEFLLTIGRPPGCEHDDGSGLNACDEFVVVRQGGGDESSLGGGVLAVGGNVPDVPSVFEVK